MWEPRCLTTLWAFTACYRDSFTVYARRWRKSRKAHNEMAEDAENEFMVAESEDMKIKGK
jgi:hypothetical protein